MGLGDVLSTVRNFFRSGAVEVMPDGPFRLSPWSAYRGHFPAVLRPSRTDPNAEDNVRLPLIGQIVDTSVSFLVGGTDISGGSGVTLDVDGEDDGAAQQILDEFCTRSKFQVTVQKGALNGAVRGHAFFKLIITNGKPDRMQIVPSDCVTVSTDPRDCETAVGFDIIMQAQPPVAGATSYQAAVKGVDRFREVVTRAEDGQSWTIVQYIDKGGKGQWAIDGEPVEWPYSFAPIFDCQNLTNVGDYWGRPDATAAIINQNVSINIALSMGARLLRNHANPKTILTGLKGGTVDWKVDGAVILPDGAAANQLDFNAGGASAIVELYHELREALHTTSRTPEVASGKLEGSGGLSGTALSILYGPLESKTGEKRLHYGDALSRLAVAVLELSGVIGKTVSVVWPDTTPRNLLEQRQAALIDEQLGIVSKETLAKSLGYDWATEDEQMEDEAETAGERSMRNFDHGLDGNGKPLPPPGVSAKEDGDGE